MTNISETPRWENDIYLVKRGDKVEGGVGGVANVQASQLANRTSLLKQMVDGLQSGISPYNSKEEAQADIAAGNVAEGARFAVWSDNAHAWAQEYQNINGVATATGKFLPSKEFTDLLYGMVTDLFKRSVPDGWKTIFPDDNGNFTVGIDDVGRLIAGLAKMNKAEIGTADAKRLNLGNIFLSQGDDGNALALHDVLMNICMAITEGGVLKVGKSEINTLRSLGKMILPDASEMTRRAVSDFLWAWDDDNGDTCVGLKKNGAWAAGRVESNTVESKHISAETLEVKAITSPAFLRYFSQAISSRLPDIAHKIGYGQSLAAGVNTKALITIAALYTALRFIGGVRAQDGSGTSAENHAQLVPYVETFKSTANGDAWETPMAASIRGWYELMIAENHGFNPDDLIILGSVPAEGSQSIASLTSGTYLQRVYDDITYGYARAQELGKTYRPVAMYWLQGEADQTKGTTKADYQADFDRMQKRIDDHASAVCGEEIHVPIFVYQFSSWINRTPNTAYPTIPLALLELAQTRENVYLTNPMYIHDYTDGAHLTARSSYIQGLYISVMEKRALVDGKTAKPLMPIGHKRQGRAATVWLNPVGRLVVDTSVVSDPGNYGLRLLHPDTLEVIPLTGVSIRYDAVNISTATDIPAGAILQYAFHGGTTGQSPGRLSGPRGCLRDSQGDIVRFTLNGEVIRMDNYCVMFELTL
ncbi:hypothetical protein [Klebsiella pneumoniae]|uniref:hypothetical protein n=1 Tax=Klebsiella pneumoniae TaxID=573 RepID=UPI00263AFE0A|nr:hypothetical protein [Klebsiella pneumoniae]MDN4867983.1 hypothetical protein [Klebsiella pneumoniae]MDN4905021.1 hypothetical protein [Klebsiella pneumoniae]